MVKQKRENQTEFFLLARVLTTGST
jgi:hypothetical protein